MSGYILKRKDCQPQTRTRRHAHTHVAWPRGEGDSGLPGDTGRTQVPLHRQEVEVGLCSFSKANQLWSLQGPDGSACPAAFLTTPLNK